MERIPMGVKAREELDPILGKSGDVWTQLFSFIRMNYVLDEFWDGKDELKFKRSGKTFATFYVHEGYFTLLIIFGKKERSIFEERQAEFPQYIVDFYHASKTYHDGKWMFFDVYDDSYIDSFIELLKIKKKPNRRTEDLSIALLGTCGNRCDKCLLYFKNSADGGNLIFQEGDWKCYHKEGEPAVDYSNIHCKGCRDSCNVSKCAASRGYQSCIECNYENCNVDGNNFTIPGRCNIGISNEDVERFILPYCGKERFDEAKKSLK